jgi:CelD/BcsL family acetyltransferase involved in cellulose biosynthesis
VTRAATIGGAADTHYSVKVHSDLAALSGSQVALFRAAGRESLFHTLPWYRNFLQSGIVPGERMRAYAVDGADGEARALLLMQHEETGGGLLRGRTLSGMANYYSSLFGPVVDPATTDLEPVLDALAARLARDDVPWDTVDLHPMSRESPAYEGMMAALSRAGFAAHRYFCFGNWYLPVNGQSYEAWLNTRTSRLSKTGRRTRRTLGAGQHFRFELFTSPGEVERGIADYETVYHSSWKIPEPHPQFVAGLMRTCAEQGWLRLGIGYYDGQPAAAQIWIVVEGIASIFKMAYDERFSKYSIGTAVSLTLMEHAIETDKVHTVDYLSGDDAYKRDWMTDRRERWGIVAYNLRTPQGLLAAAKQKAGGVVKRVRSLVRPGATKAS